MLCDSMPLCLVSHACADPGAPFPPSCHRYWLRFLALGCLELPLYAWRRRRRSTAAAAACNMAVYWAAVEALWLRNPVATLYTLLLPYALSSFLLMFGNWCVCMAPALSAQHCSRC